LFLAYRHCFLHCRPFMGAPTSALLVCTMPLHPFFFPDLFSRPTVEVPRLHAFPDLFFFSLFFSCFFSSFLICLFYASFERLFFGVLFPVAFLLHLRSKFPPFPPGGCYAFSRRHLQHFSSELWHCFSSFALHSGVCLFRFSPPSLEIFSPTEFVAVKSFSFHIGFSTVLPIGFPRIFPGQSTLTILFACLRNVPLERLKRALYISFLLFRPLSALQLRKVYFFP